MEKTKIKLNIMKKYNTQRNVGKAKYVINYHDGVKKHSDGSDFYDIQITSNKVCFNAFIKYLQNIGYTEQQRIENDKTLSPEQKEKAKIESTAKALEGLKEFKAESDRYFEYVPIEEIEKYKEFDRATEKKWGSADNTLKELVADIQKNGIKTPITLQVDINNNALVVEGNTRLAAAKKLGIKNIPVRIISGEFGSINKDKTKKLGRKRDIGEMSVFYPYVNILNQKNSPAKFGFTSITNTKNISEAYHADKAAGKETESVKDVLGTPNIQQGKISPTNTTTEFLPKEAVPNVEDWSREQQRIENDKTQLPNIKQCEQKLIFKSNFITIKYKSNEIPSKSNSTDSLPITVSKTIWQSD